MTTLRRVLPTLALSTSVLCFSTYAAAQTTPSTPAPGSSTASPSTATKPSEPSAPKTPGGPGAAAPPGTDQTSDAIPKENTDEAEEKDTKRAIYFSGDVGFTRVDIGAFSNDLGFDNTAANGVMYGFGAGVRMKDMRYGLRWRVWDTTEYALWAVAASIGYGLPIRPLSPVFSLHVGYTWDQKIQQGALRGTLPTGTVLAPDVDLKGLVAGVDVNASYWITRFLRLGAFIGADFYYLHRAQAPLPISVFPIPQETRNSALFGDSGSGLGFAVNVGLRGAFDIAF